MIAVIDYGMGNLHSVCNALEHLGVSGKITRDPADLQAAERLILPGVGAFPDAMQALEQTGLKEEILRQCRAGKPLLGICLGMQLLFEYSLEYGRTEGLALVSGGVVPIDAKGLKIPHIGWNDLQLTQQSPVLASISSGDYVYFVHSFRAETAPENILASTQYGERIPALVKSPALPVYGAQFHPEKSHETGLRILENFCKGENL